MPKTVKQIQKTYREKMRAKGFHSLTVWVLKENVAKIKAIEKADKAKGE